LIIMFGDRVERYL